MPQFSQSGRVVLLVAVSKGQVFTAQPGAVSWTAAINGTGNPTALNFTGILYSAQNIQKLWFADGQNWAYYDPTDNTVHTWTATAGTLPVDSQGNKPRLICTWRGRTVLSGLLKDPQNWFMSAVGDPTNFNYLPAFPTPTQAMSGNNSPLGLIGDVVTGLVPYTDDVLIFGGDHSIYRMQGDPQAGGSIDLVSDVIGFAWGNAWTKDPYGNIYFVSNRMGIYTLIPGQQPVRISQSIEQLLQPVDTGASSIRLLWDDRFQGLHVFVSPTAAATPGATHFYYDVRSGAWWTDQFANPQLDPLCCVIYDGNLPTDRVPIIGSWDGFARALDPLAADDDGTPINSAVSIGPLVSPVLDDMLLKALQPVLGVTSGPVNYSVYVGPTAEAAALSTPVATGTWTNANGGRNFTSLIQRSSHAIYLKVSSTSQWSMESIRTVVLTQGKVRQRGK